MKFYVNKSEGGILPTKAHFDDAGYDFYTPTDFSLCGGDSCVIDLHVAVQIPIGYCGFMRSRSGLNIKHRIRVCDGTIDSGFRGTIKVRITNAGTDDYYFKAGDRICQMVVVPCGLFDIEGVDHLDDSISGRNDAGWGSSGR